MNDMGTCAESLDGWGLRAPWAKTWTCDKPYGHEGDHEGCEMDNENDVVTWTNIDDGPEDGE